MAGTKMFHTIIDKYYDTVKGRDFPHSLVLNPEWREPLSTLARANRYGTTASDIEANTFLGASIRFDEAEPDFRFEDVRE